MTCLLGHNFVFDGEVEVLNFYVPPEVRKNYKIPTHIERRYVCTKCGRVIVQ